MRNSRLSPALKQYLGADLELSADLMLDLSPLERLRQNAFRERLTTGRECTRNLPTEFRNGSKPISDEQAIASENATSDWMDEYKVMEINRVVAEESLTVSAEPVFNLLRGEKTLYLVEVGLGTGMGLRKTIHKALCVGIVPLLYDFLEVAADNAKKVIAEALNWGPYDWRLDEIVKMESARNVWTQLVKPRQTRLSIAARLNEHQQPLQLARTLVGEGRILAYPGNKVIKIHTPADGNNNKRTTSIAYFQEFFIQHLERGARRERGSHVSVKVVRDDSYRSVTSKLVAWTFEGAA